MASSGSAWQLAGRGDLVRQHRSSYAHYGKSTPGLAERHRPGHFGYGAYRCIGSDGHRLDGTKVCTNRPVRGDRVERAVWAEVEAILNDPARVAHEYRQRLAAVTPKAGRNVDVDEVDRRIGTLRRGVGRLIDGYAEGVIERAELKPRVSDLRNRVAQLEGQRKELGAAAEVQRDLTLVVGRLETFPTRVREHLDRWTGLPSATSLA